jgi:hypothetical protein
MFLFRIGWLVGWLVVVVDSSLVYSLSAFPCLTARHCYRHHALCDSPRRCHGFADARTDEGRFLLLERASD